MSNRFNDPTYDPRKNPHERYRAGQVAIARKSEQEAEQRKTQPVEQPKRPVSAGGTTLTPELATLKAASDAEIQARKQAPVAVSAPGLDWDRQDDHQDIMNLVELFWKNNWAKYNFASQFNRMNFVQYMLHRVSQGLARWATPFFEQAAAQLQREGYFEPAARRRGEPAAKVIPIWQAPAAPAEVVTQAEAIRRSRTEISAEERERLNNMPLEELRKQARAGFKPDPNVWLACRYECPGRRLDWSAPLLQSLKLLYWARLLGTSGAELDRGFGEWSGEKRRKHRAKHRALCRLSQSRGRPEAQRLRLPRGIQLTEYRGAFCLP